MDIVPILFQLLLVIFLIAMNGFFVAAEFACVKIRPSRLETLIQEGSRQAKYAKKLTDHLDASLSVTQLGITLASLGLGWVGEPAVATLILPITHAIGLDDVIGHTISLALAFSIITGLHIVLGELTPKTMAIQNVEKIMLSVALPMLVFHRVMYPFVWLLNHVANWVAHRMGFHTASEGDDAHTEEEIRLLMEESHRQGLIDDTEVDFVDNVFDFTDLNVREIMTPRTDMVCLYLEDTMDENLHTILEEQLTRYPICHEDKDHIVGFLHVKDLMRVMAEGRKPNLRRLARKALIVPESMDVSVLLKTMQKQRSQMAIVVDEYGGTSGVVTTEDLLESIVGNMEDEYDQEEEEYQKVSDNIFILDGSMSIEDVEELLGCNIGPEEDYDTLSGLITDKLDRIPAKDEHPVVRINNVEFTVLDTEERRIAKLRADILPEEPKPEEPDEE